MVCSPLEQFQVLSIFLLLSNVWLYSGLYLCFLTYIFFPIWSKKTIHTSYVFSSFFFLSLRLIKMIKHILFSTSTFGDFFILIFFNLNFFLLIANVFGLVPLGFTLTAHLIISLSWSTFFFIWINLIFFLRFFLEWGALFLPSGTPTLILPLIIPIEILSYFSRMLSLAIRLFANMMSGHTLLHILISFFYINLTSNLFLFIPFIVIHMIMFMEVGVAFLQVYVFLVLISLYLNDTRNFSTH